MFSKNLGLVLNLEFELLLFYYVYPMSVFLNPRFIKIKFLLNLDQKSFVIWPRKKIEEIEKEKTILSGY